jgi:fluoroquinolone transport system permease protein
MGAFVALALKDARVIYRDRLLLTITGMTLAIAAGLRVLVRFVPIEMFDLYVAPAAALIAPMMLGIVLGFALIEEREQGTWLLLRVLPLSEAKWFFYVLLTSTSFAFLLGLAAARIYRRPSDAVFLVWMTAAGALTAPMMTLTLGAFARNKIEGTAVQKLASALSFAPLVVFFLPPALQLLAAWCPWYWLYLGFLRAYAGDPSTLPRVLWPGFPDWLLFLAPASLSLLTCLALARLYRRRTV